MMIFYYFPILGLTYYYSEPNIIMDIDELPKIDISVEECLGLMYQKGIVLVDSLKESL